MTRVGVLGGGQLGWMLGRAGGPLGARFRFWDRSPIATAGAAGDLFEAPFDPARAAEFAAGLDVATFEFENVPVAVASAVAEHVPTFPAPRSLEVCQDRLLEKQLFGSLGIPVNAFAPVDDAATLEDALASVGLPAVVKTRTSGYDGKGQRIVRTADEARRALAELGGMLLLEAFVPFELECSAVVVRARSGETRSYPLFDNEHRGGILHRSRFVEPRVAEELAAATDHAARIATALDHVGVLTLELFAVRKGGALALVANEIAPRVHNSAHLTIEGATTSQFENHVRAVLDLPLGDTTRLAPAAMVNLVGSCPETREVLRVPGAHLHLYGKSPAPGRKLGHVTITGVDETSLAASLEAVLSLVEKRG